MKNGLLPTRLPALLALANGDVFSGFSIGARGEAQGEVVFNTSMTGYQEILTDASYANQLITLTYPHIGNTGINDEDHESRSVFASGLIIRELSPMVSNWRAKQSLSEYLKQQNKIAIAGIDTRRLTRILREQGAQSGCIVTENIDSSFAIAKARAFAGLHGKDLAIRVTTKNSYQLPAHTDSSKFHVVVYDFGVKTNMLTLLQERGCRLTVVPADTSAKTVLSLKPDGVCLSNGPGDPAACDYAIAAIRVLLAENMPLFGICLGFQLLGLACGAKTKKMKCGHHGANHPVQNVLTKKVFITSQNHGFSIDENTLPAELSITHISLFDGTLQGISHHTKPAIGFQGHPEASPGPHDMTELFDQFIQLMTYAKTK